MNNRTNIIITLLFAASCAFVSCDDWTDIESIDIKQPSIEEQNPELYTKYLENLRQYKAEPEHKKVYGWFDNSEKNPFSRAQHMVDLPDSIDIVGLNSPANLAEFEKEEITILQQKGTKVVYAISYEDIKAKYDELLDTENGLRENKVQFNDYIKSEVEKQLSFSIPFDGIVIKYNGKNPQYMNDVDRTIYAENQYVFMNTLMAWKKSNSNKFLSFEGKPQNLIDKKVLDDFLHIIIDSNQVTNENELQLTILQCLATDVPIDRLIIATSSPSLDATEGFWGTLEAIVEIAYWITAESNEYTKAGISINNIQYDYYRTNGFYQTIRETINIMNPAPIK